MDHKQFFSTLQQFQFQTVENICCGVWRGYAVSLRIYAGAYYYVDVAIRADKPKDVKKTVKRALKVRKLASVAFVGTMSITLTVKFPKHTDPANHFTTVMEEITSTLNANGIYPANTCAMSGAANPDSLCIVYTGNGLSYQPVMSHIIQEQTEKVAEKVEDNENNGSLLTGMVGAVVGAIVGIIVNVLLMVFTKRMYALAFALVPVAAMFGYKLLKGKATKLSMVIVIVLSAISVPLMCVLNAVLFVSTENKLSLGDAFSGVTALMETDPSFKSNVYSDLPSMILFMALGVLIAWGYMLGSLNSSQIKGSQAQVSSMRPNPLYQLAQPAAPQYAQVPQSYPDPQTPPMPQGFQYPQAQQDPQYPADPQA